MAEVKPFAGVRYDQSKAGGDMANLLCPPYDVISPQEQQSYLAKSPYNVIRLELGEVQSTDDSIDNRYTRASSQLEDWLQAGVLIKEQRPAYYLYEQEFGLQGQTYQRRSLLASVRLHEWDEGVVLPHEHTLAKPKADRLSLLQATHTNLSPIFCVYTDNDGQVANASAPQATTQLLYEFKDPTTGDLNRLWLLDEPEVVARLEQAFADKKLYMADGHHRYETALTYQAERRAAGDPEGGSADYVLMALAALEDPGLVVLPYHRQVQGLNERELLSLNQNLPSYFDMEEVNIANQAKPGTYMAEFIQELDGNEITTHVFGMYGNEPDKMTVLKLKTEESISDMMPPHSEAWQHLDVSIFQTVVLEGCLGMSEESISNEEKLSYTRSIEEGVAKVRQGELQLLFILPPTRVAEMLAVADAHDQMPPKSTYFYPKFLTGIVMRLLD